MQGCLRFAWRTRWLTVGTLLVAVVLVVNLRLAFPQEFPGLGLQPPGQLSSPSVQEPPMVDEPKPGQAPASPRSPFVPPYPAPLSPDQTGSTFVPGFPFSSQETADPPEPFVRLHVRAPASVEPDKEIEYRITVENASRADAHHVMVRDRLPKGVEEQLRAEPKPSDRVKTKDGLTDLLWDLGSLKAGDRKEIVLAIKPKGNDDVQNRAYVQYEHGQNVTTRIAKPGLQVKTIIPAQAILYQPITFRIEVGNTGTAALRDVVLTEELPPGLEFLSGKPQPNSEKPFTWKLGDIPPGEQRSVEYQAISQKTGKYSNKANATAAGGLSASHNASVEVGEAKLKVSMSGPKRRAVHRPIPYHITVRNVGNVPLANVQISDEIPNAGRGSGFELLHASPLARFERGFVRWSLGVLSPGERRSLLVVLRAPSVGWCWNAITARADPNQSEKTNAGWTHIDSADAPVLEIDKSSDSLAVGEKASYTIRFINLGKRNLINARLTVAVPEQLSVLGSRGATTGHRDGQTIHFDAVDALNKGEEKDFIVEVEAKKAGSATLRASWVEGVESLKPMNSYEDVTTVLDSSATPPPPLADKSAPGKEKTYEANDFSRQRRVIPTQKEPPLGN
jgi:uncharacterized repeat protein (TIGR01451 family)